jgi:hypothetical protein
MNRERENDDLIELSTASGETRGPSVGMDDSQGGLRPYVGLSDE